jgi:hypothetical protein
MDTLSKFLVSLLVIVYLGLGVGLTTLPCKKENCWEASKKFSRIFGGGQGLSWAVEPRKEREICNDIQYLNKSLS